MGIDVEEIEPRRENIFGYVASDEEWRLFGGKSWDSLYRCWTAKEAVVKSTGTGLAGLNPAGWTPSWTPQVSAYH